MLVYQCVPLRIPAMLQILDENINTKTLAVGCNVCVCVLVRLVHFQIEIIDNKKYY